ARSFTDMPFLVELNEREAAHAAGRFLRASDLDGAGVRGAPGPELQAAAGSEHADWKTVVLDERTGDPAVLNGSIGDRYGEEGIGRWNLELGDVEPALTMLGHHDELVEVELPRFDTGESEGGATMRRGVPARRIGNRLVTTVFDLFSAQLGVAREGLPGEWPESYEDASIPYTPAWQEEITGVDAGLVTRIAREFARNAERTEGRSMIFMGAGTNHWYHSDETYRAMLSLLLLCGCQGRNGGGWAHYVGQEKVRPFTGFATIGFALDWSRPPRQQATTPFWYLATDQWRYEELGVEEITSPLGEGSLNGKHFADCNALAARLGWLPSFPTFDRNPLDIVAEADAKNADPAQHTVEELQNGKLNFACEDPDAPEAFPRVLTLWRANLIGSSSKGHEYFLRHLLGVPETAGRRTETPPERRPNDVRWRDEAPEGKLDLFTTIDFRMNGSCLYSDVVLPAATWYEKHDISSTDLHPFVHSFDQAVPPPWEAKTDWETFNLVADAFSHLAEKHLGVRRDLVAAPLMHDSPDELAQPGGVVRDWRAGECEPIPGRTMPKLVVVERDYPAVAERLRAIGPLAEKLGGATKAIPFDLGPEVEALRHLNGVVRGGSADGRPKLETDVHACDAILAFSGTTNGRLAVEGFRALEERTGQDLVDLALDREDDRLTYESVSVQPRKVVTSPEWSGIESRERRYSPFTVNVDRKIPWRTLTGRQQLYVDHDWMLELGEGLPAYRPPLEMRRHAPELARAGTEGVPEVVVQWITPHSKWSIHSEFQDNLHMLTLFRGGPVAWIAPADAERIEVSDNDWIEVHNANGVIACRAVVSHRVPEGSALMYHAQDRHVNVPISEVSGERGGIDNSVTRIMVKPTHMIGGYAQLSWGFNYYGPTGVQRDELTVIRKRQGDVVYR
ncbi:MAG: nitrate reductase subunit alpha, partial [Solirubrobacterales bacterium]